MTTIIRVKRRHDAEPLDSLLVTCKRSKIENYDKAEEPADTIVKFAVTVKNQDDVVEQLRKTFSKKELEDNFKHRTVDIGAKLRIQSKENSINNRYKVINCVRSLNTSNLEEPEEEVTTVIDLEDSISCENSSLPSTTAVKEDEYVYDVYYTYTNNEMYIDNSVSVYPFGDQWNYETYRDSGDNSQNENESDDSNSESHWKNDYPDSDHSEDSIDENDMRMNMEKMRLNDEEYDLSSDEDFVHFENETDVERFGSKYAEYKFRMNKELAEELVSDISESSQDNDEEFNEDEENKSNVT